MIVSMTMKAATGLVAIMGCVMGAVKAQVNVQATCSVSELAWTFNQENQSPCEVSARLQSVCHSGKFQIRPLQSGQSYTGPLKGSSDPCVCSTVVYSLVSACAVCQGSTPLPWQLWMTNCTASDVGLDTFTPGIPKGTSIPTWAFLDATPDWNIQGSFDNANLKQADITSTNRDGSPITGTTTQSSQSSQSTADSSSVSSPTTSGTATNSNGGGDGNGRGRGGENGDDKNGNNGTKKSSSVGPIVGGVVGGIVALALIGALAFFLLRRRRKNQFRGATPIGSGGANGAQTSEYRPDFSRPAPVGSPLPTVVPYYVNDNTSPEPQLGSTGKGYVPYPNSASPPPPPQYQHSSLSPSTNDTSYSTTGHDRPQSMTYFPNPYGSPSSPNAFNAAPATPPSHFGSQYTGPAPYGTQQIHPHPGMGYTGVGEV